MREFDVLAGYPEPANPRVVGPKLRTIHNRIIASYRDKELYDGDRNNGYGGFRYDGRWVPIVRNMVSEYGLDGTSSVLQVNCEKGFILHDFKEQIPGIRVQGTEVSQYAIDHAMDTVRDEISCAPFTELPYPDSVFDFVLAMGAVYSLTLADAISCLKEIQRVGKGKAFITLAAYETDRDKRLFEWWTLLGATLLHKRDWIEVMRHAGYTGDYKFTTAESLKLEAEDQ